MRALSCTKPGRCQQEIQWARSTQVGSSHEAQREGADADGVFGLVAYAGHESSSHVVGAGPVVKKPGRIAGSQMAFLLCLRKQ